MSVNSSGAREALSGSGAPGDGLVIPEAFIAEQQVVHRPLAGRRDPESAQHHVDKPLRGLDVARRHRRAFGRVGRRRGVEEALRKDKLKGLQDPGIERYGIIDEATKTVQNSARNEGRGGVEVVVENACRAGEIKQRPALAHLHPESDFRPVIELILKGSSAPRQPVEVRFHQAAGGSLYVGHISQDGCPAADGDELFEPPRAGPVRRDLGLDIGQVLPWTSRWPGPGKKNLLELVKPGNPGRDDLEIPQQHPLL